MESEDEIAARAVVKRGKRVRRLVDKEEAEEEEREREEQERARKQRKKEKKAAKKAKEAAADGSRTKRAKGEELPAWEPVDPLSEPPSPPSATVDLFDDESSEDGGGGQQQQSLPKGSPRIPRKKDGGGARADMDAMSMSMSSSSASSSAVPPIPKRKRPPPPPPMPPPGHALPASASSSSSLASAPSGGLSSLSGAGAAGDVVVGQPSLGRGTSTHKPKRPTAMASSAGASTGGAGAGAVRRLPASTASYGSGSSVTKTRASFDRQLLEWDLLKAWEEDLAPSAKLPVPKDDEPEEGELPAAKAADEEEEGEITADESGGGGKRKTAAKKELPQKEKVEEGERWTPVPDTFSSAAQYVDVWFPLLLQEMRAETLSEVTTEGLGAFSKVSLDDQGTQSDGLQLLRVTKFETPPTLLPDGKPGKGQQGGGKGEPWQQVGLSGRPLRDCGQYELVLLVQDIGPVLDALCRQKGVPPRPAARAEPGSTPPRCKTLAQAGGFLGMVSPRQGGRVFQLRVSSNRWRRHGSSTMHACAVKTLVSSIREVQALLKVNHFKILPRLLNGDRDAGGPEPPIPTVGLDGKRQRPPLPPPIVDAESAAKLLPPGLDRAFDELGKGFVERVMAKFNPSQVIAIKAAATHDGFTLIKGPPGTGKTTTLNGLLNSIHLREYQRFYKSVLRISQLDDEETDKGWLRYKEAKPHILVTAPSNVAVDNIVQRIMADGFLDGNGQRYNPPLVRMGRMQSDQVRAVSLDAQVDELLRAREDALRARAHSERVAIEGLKQSLAVARFRFRLLCRSLPAASGPLPFGWEADVDPGTGQLVFSTTNGPRRWQHERPTEPALEEGQAAEAEDGRPLVGPVLEQLRSYQALAGEVTRLVEVIETKSMEVGRMEIRLLGVGPSANPESLKTALETNFLDTAHLVFTTLNGAGVASIIQGRPFHVVVVDEAAQAIEPSTLIPLQTGARTCVLVGDPQQLPATVFSQLGASTAFERSLFERLEHGGHPVHLLDTQYRMHPRISAFPRRHFYGSLLKDGPNVAGPGYSRPWHSVPAFQPFVFLDLRSDTNRGGAGGVSYKNTAEAILLANLYLLLRKESQGDVRGRTGVITPYQLQLGELHHQFARLVGPNYQAEVELNTVDGYQGKEKDVILFSCVRAGGTKGIGFLADVRRMNVGLTRGRLAVLVVGRRDTLRQNRHWRALLEHAAQTGALVPVPSPGCNLLALKSWDGEGPNPNARQGPPSGQQGQGPRGQSEQGGRGGDRGKGHGGRGRGPTPLMPPVALGPGARPPHVPPMAGPPRPLRPPPPPQQQQQQQQLQQQRALSYSPPPVAGAGPPSGPAPGVPVPAPEAAPVAPPKRPTDPRRRPRQPSAAKPGATGGAVPPTTNTAGGGGGGGGGGGAGAGGGFASFARAAANAGPLPFASALPTAGTAAAAPSPYLMLAEPAAGEGASTTQQPPLAPAQPPRGPSSSSRHSPPRASSRYSPPPLG